MSQRNDNLEVVLVGWIDAQRRNDLDAIERHLHPDVIWQGLRSDLVCRNRDQVLDNVRSRGGARPDVEGIELHAEGDQVLFGVRSPDLVEVGGERLDGEVYDVFTIADGLIVRMDAYRTRDEALEAMRARREATEKTGMEPLKRPPNVPVDDLIPFVHVHDVARSIAFYELLGFEARDTYPDGEPLDWAALESRRQNYVRSRRRTDRRARPSGPVLPLHPRTAGPADAPARPRRTGRPDSRRLARAKRRDARVRPRRLRAHDRRA